MDKSNGYSESAVLPVHSIAYIAVHILNAAQQLISLQL